MKVNTSKFKNFLLLLNTNFYKQIKGIDIMVILKMFFRSGEAVIFISLFLLL